MSKGLLYYDLDSEAVPGHMGRNNQVSDREAERDTVLPVSQLVIVQ